MSLYDVAQSINNDMSRKMHMEIGAVIMHPDGYNVKVESGCYTDPTYHRWSNWWYWRRVKEDGSLGRLESGYGW